MANRNIIQTIKKAIRDLVGEKTKYTKDDFNIIYVGTVGLEANIGEVQLVFRDQEEISMYAIMKYFTEKLSATWDPEMRTLDLFQTLDRNGKYFLDRDDIIMAWKEIDCKLPLNNLLDCFDILAPDQTLDYFSFKKLYLTYLEQQKS